MDPVNLLQQLFTGRETPSITGEAERPVKQTPDDASTGPKDRVSLSAGPTTDSQNSKPPVSAPDDVSQPSDFEELLRALRELKAKEPSSGGEDLIRGISEGLLEALISGTMSGDADNSDDPLTALNEVFPRTEEQEEALKEARDLVTVSNVTLDITRGMNAAGSDQGNKSFRFSVAQESRRAFLEMDNGRTATAFTLLTLLHTKKEDSPDPGFIQTSYSVEDAGSENARFQAKRGPFELKDTPVSQANIGYRINMKGMGKRYL